MLSLKTITPKCNNSIRTGPLLSRTHVLNLHGGEEFTVKETSQTNLFPIPDSTHPYN